MRSILLTLDDTPAAATARRIALGLARRTGATLTGIAGVDVSDLEEPEAVPLGALKQAQERREHRALQARERRARLADIAAAFEPSCATAGVQGRRQSLGEDLRDELIRAVETADLVVTGRDCAFHLESAENLSPLVEYLVARAARPVLITGPEAPDDGPVVIAYDGSAPAAKALQLALLLGLLRETPVHVVSVGPADHALAVAGRARDFLARHGIAAEIDAASAEGAPADVLCARAAGLGARLMVMGAFGHRGLRELLFGTTTRHLLHAPAVPLFVYH